ncbi:hypothetical protein [Halobacillus karajensis]|nr:hypothetical protein [Halobacillus karajensis]
MNQKGGMGWDREVGKQDISLKVSNIDKMVSILKAFVIIRLGDEYEEERF